LSTQFTLLCGCCCCRCLLLLLSLSAAAAVVGCLQVVPGELTIVTGLANSGKSEWLDALVVNLAELYGWTFGVCSLENTPVVHSTKLMEKYTRERTVHLVTSRCAASSCVVVQLELCAAGAWCRLCLGWRQGSALGCCCLSLLL
jgi:hypothetical protein